MDGQLALGIAGGIAGSLIPGVGWLMGASIGLTVGQMFFPPQLGNQKGARLKELHVMGASQGQEIPFFFGEFRLVGNVIWADALTETASTKRMGGKSGGTYTDYSYSVSMAVMFSEGPVHRINRLWANAEVVYSNDGTTVKYAKYITSDNLRIYAGTHDQERDDYMEGIVGTDECPAYRHRHYVVLKNFPLTEKFGNTIPHISSESRKSATLPTLEAVCEDLCVRCDISPLYMDFSALSGITVKGLAVGKNDVADVFRFLQMAYFFDLVEVDGMLKGVLRGDGPTQTIDAKWLGWQTGRPAPERITVKRQQEVELPKQLDIQYFSKGHDFQTMTQTAVRETAMGQQVISVALPLVLGEDEAKKVAVVNLWLHELQRDQYKTTMPWRFLGIAPGDVLTVPTDFGDKVLKVLDEQTPMLGHLSFTMVPEVPSIYDIEVTGQPVPPKQPGQGEVYEPPETVWRLVETNALNDTDADSITFYSAAAGGGQPWPGGAVNVVQRPNPRVYPTNEALAQVAVHTTAAGIGELSGKLDPPTDWRVWDLDNSVVVEMAYGQPVSAPDDLAVLNGENCVLVGTELIQFRYAVEVAQNTYELTRLLRGRRGTEAISMDHLAGEQVILVTSASIETVRLMLSEKNLQHGYEFNEFGTVTTPPDSILLQTVGYSRMPYAPTLIKGARDGSQNLDITWVRRARKNGSWQNLIDVPLDESAEQYDVQIWTVGYGVLKRTLTSTTPTVTYTAAQQVTDFGSAQPSVTVKVFQRSPEFGLGHAALAVI
jgi:hypothetical protein